MIKEYSASKSYSFIASLAIVILICACHRQSVAVDENAYRQQLERWHTERAAELKGEDGWLTLVGLYWLKEGENRLGSDPSNSIVLPQGKAPGFAGTLWLDKGVVKLEPSPQAVIKHDERVVESPLVLEADASGKPTVLTLGTLSFYVIKRGDQLGLRVKDRENPARASFAGLDYFPVDLKWLITARFEPYNPPKMIPIVNVLGMVEEQASPGRVVFDVAGKTYGIDAIAEKGSKELFLIFKDETSGKETYGAGRYLYADAATPQGTVTLDFNKAHNPPCAYTVYATCPLPPSQNRLALRVEAGEKQYAKSTH
ncbi:MAG TPA: DUF1684 domain-containing protein [Pyrinomonadaceae bacterium]|nr:DUF1684 domain-containing protein [Pyrinomonadaceae bacterium]